MSQLLADPPQSLCFLGLGLSGLAKVVVAVVAVEDVPVVLLGSVAGVAVVTGSDCGSGSGSPGLGQVTSLQSSGQISHIL